MTVRETILAQIRNVAADMNRPLAPLTDDIELLKTGLDSLSVAVLVANLEDELGLDPFGSGQDIEIPTTLGDLIQIYEKAHADIAA